MKLMKLEKVSVTACGLENTTYKARPMMFRMPLRKPVYEHVTSGPTKKIKSNHTKSNLRQLVFIAQLRIRPLQRSLLLDTSLHLDDSLKLSCEQQKQEYNSKSKHTLSISHCKGMTLFSKSLVCVSTLIYSNPQSA
jgi:hypothetical protein